MDFTRTLESLELEAITWEQIAQQEQKSENHNEHRGSVQAAREIRDFLTTIKDADPTTQARKLYAYRNTEILPKQGESHAFNRAYMPKLHMLCSDFDRYCSELYRDVHGLESQKFGPSVHAWLSGEEEENARTHHH